MNNTLTYGLIEGDKQGFLKKVSFEPYLEARVGVVRPGRRSGVSCILEASHQHLGGAGWRTSQDRANMESLQEGCCQRLTWPLKPEVGETGFPSSKGKVDRREHVFTHSHSLVHKPCWGLWIVPKSSRVGQQGDRSPFS